MSFLRYSLHAVVVAIPVEQDMATMQVLVHVSWLFFQHQKLQSVCMYDVRKISGEDLVV